VGTGDDARPDEALLRAATTWASFGWHVFPCAVGGKRPALRGSWEDRATTKSEFIEMWWRLHPYNIGVACGPSGLAVLDLDVPSHGKAAPDGVSGQATGLDTFLRLCSEHGQPVPATFTVRTPSRGYHLYFTDPDASVRNSAGRLGPLIDVRGAGGYVVGPGSRISGKPYSVMIPSPPVPLPSWIAALLRRPDPARAPYTPDLAARVRDGNAWALAALRDEARRVAAAPEGSRNHTLNRAAFRLGQLAGGGLLPADEVSAALAAAATQAGLPPAEADRTIRSGVTAGIRVPRQVPPPGPRPRVPVPECGAPGRAPRRLRTTNAGRSALPDAFHRAGTVDHRPQGLEGGFRQAGGAQRDLAHVVVPEGRGHRGRDRAALEVSLVEEVGRRHAEEPGQRQQVLVGGVVAPASLQLPHVGRTDHVLASGGVDRRGDICRAEGLAIVAAGGLEQVLQPGREQPLRCA
jgi:hypothetical protein